MKRTYLFVVLGIAAVAGVGILYSIVRGPAFIPSPMPPVVELKDGESYGLTAGFIEKKVGGDTYRMLAYNGSIPGPLLKIPQGAEVTINFKNDTGMKTLFHSHGVRMDNPFDGSQTTQKEMDPGETFVYKLKFLDPGVYWYHPHVREDYQQELGLYGNYLVVPNDKNYWSPVNQEIPLFLDDILLENGEIRLSTAAANRTLMGRFGNVMLVNGEVDYHIAAKKGEVIRFYITNAANTRPFNFAIPGAKMKLVGGDGGAYEREEWIDSVVLGPSERAVIEVLFEERRAYAMEHRTPDATYPLGVVYVSGEEASSYTQEFSQLKTHQATVQSIDPFRPYFDRAPDKQLKLSLDMMGGMMSSMGGHGMPDGSSMGVMEMGGGIARGGIEWEDTNPMMNQMSYAGSIAWKIVDQVTGKENSDIDWVFRQGKPVMIRIFNDPNSLHPMQHPIHFHGQRFLVVARNNVREDNFVWKDTVFVPAGETVDVLVDMANPGIWMAHCHIAEHLEAGMMFTFRVEKI